MEKALVLIVEDQMIVAKAIEAMILDHGMDVMGICKSGEEAISLAETRTPDIVIMDIKLQGKKDGIQTAAALQHHEHLPIIYLSDYTNRATVRKAKETRPANYLAKPFTEADLLRAIDIAIFNANASKVLTDNDDDFVFAKSPGGTHYKLTYNEIIYIEAERSYCKIHTINGVHNLPINMASVGGHLNSSRFIRVHRSYIVNIRKVSGFSTKEVTAGGYKIPVSDQHRAELMRRLNILH